MLDHNCPKETATRLSTSHCSALATLALLASRVALCSGLCSGLQAARARGFWENTGDAI